MMQTCFDDRRPFRSHQDIVCRSQVLSIEGLTGCVRSMYAIPDQCRVELAGQDGAHPESPDITRWVYRITMPIMLLTDARAARSQVTFTATLCTPFSEEKMRFGSQLHCECDVYPFRACELSPGLYRITYDAHISLYSMLLRAG